MDNCTQRSVTQPFVLWQVMGLVLALGVLLQGCSLFPKQATFYEDEDPIAVPSSNPPVAPVLPQVVEEDPGNPEEAAVPTEADGAASPAPQSAEKPAEAGSVVTPPQAATQAAPSSKTAVKPEAKPIASARFSPSPAAMAPPTALVDTTAKPAMAKPVTAIKPTTTKPAPSPAPATKPVPSPTQPLALEDDLPPPPKPQN